MKTTMKILALGILTLSTMGRANQAAARDFYRCQMVESLSNGSQTTELTIYQMEDGKYAYHVQSCVRYHDSDCLEVSYESSGIVEPNLYDGRLTRNFQSDDVKIISICGGISFTHMKDGEGFYFMPLECKFSPQPGS